MRAMRSAPPAMRSERRPSLRRRTISTRALPSKKTILGNFTPGKNVLRTPNPDLIFAMIAADDGFFQSAVDIHDPQNLTGRAEKFDVVVGSGRHGQTYLYWKGDELFELPVSYWTWTHAWINSPGYTDGGVHFNRPIEPRCLECHASWFESLAPPRNRYRAGQPGAADRLRAVPRAGTRACGAGAWRESTGGRIGGDCHRESGAAATRSPDGPLRAVPLGPGAERLDSPLSYLPGDEITDYREDHGAARRMCRWMCTATRWAHSRAASVSLPAS